MTPQPEKAELYLDLNKYEEILSDPNTTRSELDDLVAEFMGELEDLKSDFYQYVSQRRQHTSSP